MNGFLKGTDITECMIKAKTDLMQKKKNDRKEPLPQKLQTHTVPNDDLENTPTIKEDICNSLISHGMFPEEQKRYHESTRGT